MLLRLEVDLDALERNALEGDTLAKLLEGVADWAEATKATVGPGEQRLADLTTNRKPVGRVVLARPAKPS